MSSLGALQFAAVGLDFVNYGHLQQHLQRQVPRVSHSLCLCFSSSLHCLLSPPSERNETGGHTVFSLCGSMCLCTLSPVGLNGRTAEKCIRLVREKLRIFPCGQYITGNVVLLALGSRSKWGLRRNVQKCNSYITQSQQASTAAMTS